MAVQFNELESLRALIASDADMDLRNAQGWTAIHLAVLDEKSDFVDALLDSGADVTLRGGINLNRTPLDLIATDSALNGTSTHRKLIESTLKIMENRQ